MKIRVVSPTIAELFCDCGHMSRTTYACGHILCLKKAIHGEDFDILNPEQKFHPRLLKSLYWGVHHSKKRVDHNDVIPLPVTNREAFMRWFHTQPQPSYLGVPEVGRIGQTQQHDDSVSNPGDAPGDADHSGNRRSKTRIQKLQMQRLSKVQENHYEIMEICKQNRVALDRHLQDQEDFLQDWRNRKRTRNPGRQTVDRLRGAADRDKGVSAHAYKPRKIRKKEEDPVLKLREHIRKNGLASGTYVQIENRENEKWFMRITKGNVIDADGDDPAIECALWCKPNCVSKLDTAYGPQKCEIKTIMDAGPYVKFKNMLQSTCQ